MWGGPEATTCGKHYLAYENGRKFSRLQEKSDATPCRQAVLKLREFPALSARILEPVAPAYQRMPGSSKQPARGKRGRWRAPGYQVTAASTSAARPLSSVSAGSRFAPALR